MELEARFGVTNYDPLPVVLTRGAGCQVWDFHGRGYLDFHERRFRSEPRARSAAIPSPPQWAWKP